jgi:hypothetical protein
MSAATKGVWFATTPYRLAAKDASQETNRQPIPQGYLRLSDAYHRLHAGIWGGLEPPVPVQAFKAKFKSSARYAGWRTYAARGLTTAALEGQLRVYVVADPYLAPNIDNPRAAPPPTKDPTIVPTSVLQRLMTWRGMLPDRAIRPTIKITCGDLKLFVLLTGGILFVQEREFTSWYRSERSKGKWPSQATRSKKGRGRPTKQTEPLKKAILALADDQAWSGKDGVAKLRRLLKDGGHLAVSDTLGRFIDRLYVETAKPALVRKLRVRRTATRELTAKFRR